MSKPLLFPVLILSLFVVVQTASSQGPSAKKNTASSKPAASSPVIMTVGTEKITLQELERNFKKNMSRKNSSLTTLSRDSVMDFLRLYSNYRLKVQDAVQRGFDKDTAVVAELEQNRRMLSETYFFDKKLVEPNVELMLKRRANEVQIAVIVVTPKADGKDPVADSIATLRRAENLLRMAKSTSDFSALARDSSDDKETAVKGGLLPFFTSGKVLRQIEEAAYSGTVGQVYPSLVSYRGMHFIVKVLANEPRVRVRASHILVQYSGTGKTDDSLAADRKADSIIRLVKSGVSFEKLASENSDDPSSRDKGGYLGNYYVRSKGLENVNELLVPEFESAIYALKDGQMSGKVWTEYGVHIVRRDSTKPLAFEEERDQVKKDYKRIYFEDDKRRLVDSIRLALGFRVDDATYREFLGKLDNVKTATDTNGYKEVGPMLRTKILASGPQMRLTVANFIDSLQRRADFKFTVLNETGIKKALDKLVDPPALNIATMELPRLYPDFAALLKEFHDGILLFRVEDKEVWSQLKFDSTKARAYFDTMKVKPQTGQRYDLSEINVLSDSLAKTIKGRLDKGESFEQLAGEFTVREGMREKKGRLGVVTIKESKIAASADKRGAKAGEVFGPEQIDRGFSIVKVNNVLESRQKTFEEAITDFAGAYTDWLQKGLTNQWLDRIRKKNPVVFNQKAINSTFSNK